MSTLTMALTAALLAGSAPQKVSGETVERLPLGGEWKGEWQHPKFGLLSTTMNGQAGRGYIVGTRDGLNVTIPPGLIVHQSGGRFRLGFTLGIYMAQGDQLLLCFRLASEGYPTAFRGGNGQHLITLHRVKPRK